MAESGDMSQLDGWNRKADLAHADKEQRIAQLQKMTSMSLNTLGVQQNMAQSNIEEGNRKKTELSREVNHSRKMLEDIAMKFQQMQVNIEAIDQRTKNVERNNADLKERVEILQKQTDNAVSEKLEKVVARIKAEEDSRLLLGQEFQMALDQREKRLQQKIETDVRDESAARQSLIGDIAKLSEQIKDMKIHLQDECSKCHSTISILQTKASKQFVEVNEHMNAERTARERASAVARNDLSQRCGEMKSLVEGKSYELSKEMKAVVSQLGFLIENVRQELEKSNTQRDKMFDVAEKSNAKSLGDVNSDLSMRMDVERNDAANKHRSLQDGINEVKELIKWEVVSRERAFTSAQEMMAQEHYRREQDEGTIIALLEGFMKQMRDMNSVSSANN